VPLKRGSSKKSVSKNISTLRHEGKPEAQAVAISLDIARRGKRKPKRKDKK